VQIDYQSAAGVQADAVLVRNAFHGERLPGDRLRGLGGESHWGRERFHGAEVKLLEAKFLLGTARQRAAGKTEEDNSGVHGVQN